MSYTTRVLVISAIGIALFAIMLSACNKSPVEAPPVPEKKVERVAPKFVPSPTPRPSTRPSAPTAPVEEGWHDVTPEQYRKIFGID